MVAEVDEVLVREADQALVEDGEPADAGVEHADRPRVDGGARAASAGDAARGHRAPAREAPARSCARERASRRRSGRCPTGDGRRHSTGLPRHRAPIVRSTAGLCCRGWPRPVRIGTCSFADEALIKHWYPRGLPPRERLAYYAERFSTVEIDSTFYRVPSRATVQGWADRTPPGFVVHIKAFGVMTRHPVPLARLPPELRAELPVDERGRVDRPSPRLGRSSSRSSCAALEPLRAAGKLGGILFQLPPYVVPKPLDASTTSSGRATSWTATTMLVEFRHRVLVRRGAAGRRCSASSRSAGCPTSPSTRPGSTPPTCRATLVAATSPIAYVRFHGRNAATWNRRGGGAAQRFDYLYGAAELGEWVEPLRELAGAAEHAYALFNNNNATDGVGAGARRAPRSCAGCSRSRDVPVA